MFPTQGSHPVKLTALIAVVTAAIFPPGSPAIAQRADHVIHISMDGLRPDAITALGPTLLPNFYRLRTEGAFTDNARTDYDFTSTLPNHVCQLTGRRVYGPSGHNWTSNSDPLEGETLESNNGGYVAGVFDVVHDFGRRTGLYASKSKFSLFATSWNATNGTPDIIGTDEGRNKIDVCVINTGDTAQLVNTLIADMAARPFNYVFLHLVDPDAAGHGSGWDVTPGSPYSNAVKEMDRRLGRIFNLIATNSQLTGRTAIILTADHGGTLSSGHSDPSVPEDYTVPFYVWGPGVIPGLDLYALNSRSRLDPGTNRPPYSDLVQPIRNGEAANTALELLGLWPVPGSMLNHVFNLKLSVPVPPDFRITVSEPNLFLSFTTAPHVYYDIQSCDDLSAGVWSNDLTDIVGSGGTANFDLGPATSPRKFYRLRIHY